MCEGKHAGYSDELWRFSTLTRKWTLEGTTGLESPSARSDHTMEAVGTDIYLFGGGDSEMSSLNPGIDESRSWSDELWMYSTVTLEWALFAKNAGASPSARGFHSMTVVNTDLYLYGGEGGFSDWLWIYSTVSCNWTLSAVGGSLGALTWHVATAVGTRVYLFGGGLREELLAGILGSGHLWAIETTSVSLEWTVLDNQADYEARPGARNGHAIAAVGPTLYVYGGATTSFMYSGKACQTHNG